MWPRARAGTTDHLTLPDFDVIIQKIISYNCKIHQPCIQHKIPGHFNNSNATRQHQLGPGSGNVKVAAVKGTCLRFSETRAARPHAAGPPTVWQVQRVYAQSPVKPNQADSKLVHAGVPHAKATSFQQKQTRSNRRTFITFGFGLKNPEPSWSSYLKINTTNRSISHPVRFLSANLPTNRQRLDRATRDQCALSEEEFAACMCHRDVRDDWSCHQNKIQEVTMSSLRRGFHCSHTK